MLIKEYTGQTLIDLDIVKKINDLVYSSNIGERFDFGDFLYLGFIDNKLMAIEVFRLENFDTGELLPRFIHIIFSPEIRHSKKTVEFLNGAENLMQKRYDRIWAYILKNRIDMLVLARKFGFKDTEYNEEGYTLIKMIGEKYVPVGQIK